MKYNVIIVYDTDEKHILMCERTKEPYKGRRNLVGGKIEAGETGLESAYRELEEETAITARDIVLTPLMTSHYWLTGTELQVYAGKLTHTVELVEEVNPLVWVSADENFFDTSKYAGDGNIGHMLIQVNDLREQVLK